METFHNFQIARFSATSPDLSQLFPLLASSVTFSKASAHCAVLC